MNLIRSRYTLAETWSSGRGILVNTLSGAVDIIDSPSIFIIKDNEKIDTEKSICGDKSEEFVNFLLERGYYVESSDVENIIARYAYDVGKKKDEATAQHKYVFGLTLRCNLSCPYCWQAGQYENTRHASGIMSETLIDAAFTYIHKDLSRFSGKKEVFISLFGGEPLIDSPQHRALLLKIGGHAHDNGFTFHITTNGKTLAKYRDEIKLLRPSIQITIDDISCQCSTISLRRAGQELELLYETLADITIKKEACINLRFLLSEHNIDDFVLLADTIFNDLRFENNFTLAVAPIQNKTGTNIEIPSKVKILKLLTAKLKKRFYTSKIVFCDWRGLSLFRHLHKELLPYPGFYHCEANVNLSAFDYEGRLYACYEGIGDSSFSIGTYWPEISIDQEHLAQYRDRSAFSISKCVGCPLSPLCGGGCQVRGRKILGTYHEPFCDSISEEISFILQNWNEISLLLTGKAYE